MNKDLVVLINPGHDDEVPQETARSMGARSRAVAREDPPMSLLNLGARIRDMGYEVVLLDTHVEPDYKARLLELIKRKPLAIGLSVILGKFTRNAITLTSLIRQADQDVPIIWGGKLVHLAGRRILDELPVDYIVVGEAEFSLPRLLEAIKQNRAPEDIPGVGYRGPEGPVVNHDFQYAEDLDSVYTSKDFGWDLVKHNVNDRQVPYFINLYTSRGCKYNCSFCYLRDIKSVTGRFRYRRRSARNVISEIEYLNKNFGIDVFTFGDDDFLKEMGKVVPVLEHIRKKNYYIEQLWTNVNNLSPRNIELLSGICQTVCYSIETAAPRLQKVLKKSIPIDKVLKTNRLLRQAGINTVHNFIFGIPTETDAETRQNIELLKELKRINPHTRANCYIMSPIPGTAIFDFVQELAGEIKWGLDDLANFHFRYMGESANKFRPYLSREDNVFYERATVLTNLLFAEMNEPPTAEMLDEIEASERLSYIFGDLGEIERPGAGDRKYVLDKVIEAKEEGRPMPVLKPF